MAAQRQLAIDEASRMCTQYAGIAALCLIAFCTNCSRSKQAKRIDSDGSSREPSSADSAIRDNGRVSRPSSIVLQLDEAHNHSTSDHQALIYQVSATDSVTLDPAGYSIPVPHSLNASGPTILQLVIRRGERYEADWDGTRPISLTAATLRPLGASPPFRGFPAGQRCIVAAGREHSADAGSNEFDVMWAGLIDVRDAEVP